MANTLFEPKTREELMDLNLCDCGGSYEINEVDNSITLYDRSGNLINTVPRQAYIAMDSAGIPIYAGDTVIVQIGDERAAIARVIGFNIRRDTSTGYWWIRLEDDLVDVPFENIYVDVERSPEHDREDIPAPLRIA